MTLSAGDERALKLIALAIRFDLDSFDLEECCARHGLDYNSAEVEAIRRALIADYGVPGLFPPAPQNWA